MSSMWAQRRIIDAGTLKENMIEFDKRIPPKEHGFWGLKVNGDATREVIWSERKPTLGQFKSVRAKALEDNAFPGIEKLEVVRVQVVEIGSPELLADTWFPE